MRCDWILYGNLTDDPARALRELLDDAEGCLKPSDGSRAHARLCRNDWPDAASP